MSLEQNKLRIVEATVHLPHTYVQPREYSRESEGKKKKEKKKPHKSVTKISTSSIIPNSYTAKASMPGIPRSLESRSHGR